MSLDYDCVFLDNDDPRTNIENKTWTLPVFRSAAMAALAGPLDVSKMTLWSVCIVNTYYRAMLKDKVRGFLVKPLPTRVLTVEQRVTVAAQAILANTKTRNPWSAWAKAWVRGKDRTKEAVKLLVDDPRIVGSCRHVVLAAESALGGDSVRSCGLVLESLSCLRREHKGKDVWANDVVSFDAVVNAAVRTVFTF